MQEYINFISNNKIILLMIITIVADVFLGSLRALKQHKWNSTVGIDGLIRKVGVIGCTLLVAFADLVLGFNIIGNVPEEIISYLGGIRIGLTEMIGIMFTLYELTSVLKNAVILELPVPKGIQKRIKEMLDKMTTELEGKV